MPLEDSNISKEIDGNYDSTMELRFQACDTIIFLDYPLDTCLSGIKERREKNRADMPWIEKEDEAEALISVFSCGI